MSNDHITRAWKDEEYRNSLSAAERAALPENPAGSIELTSEELTTVSAGEAIPLTGGTLHIPDVDEPEPTPTQFQEGCNRRGPAFRAR